MAYDGPGISFFSDLAEAAGIRMRKGEYLFQKSAHCRDAFLKGEVRIRFTQNSETVSHAPIVMGVSWKVFDSCPNPIRCLSFNVAIGMKRPSILFPNRFCNSRKPLVFGHSCDGWIHGWIVRYFPGQMIRVSRPIGGMQVKHDVRIVIIQ